MVKSFDLGGREHAVVSVVGMRGAGKTYFTKRIIPLILEKADGLIIVDIVGVYADLEQEHPDTLVLTWDKPVADMSLMESVYKRAFEKGVKILVLDVSLLQKNEIVKVADHVSQWLLIRKDRNLRIGVVVDEVGEIIPQHGGEYSRRFESLVRIGRNRNVPFVVVTTQRPQKADKNVLALSDFYVVFRLLHNLDLEAVQHLIGLSRAEFKEYAGRIKRQGVGEFGVYDGYAWEWYGSDWRVKPDDGNGGVKRVVKKGNHSGEVKQKALAYMRKGKTLRWISEKLNVPYPTVKYWKRHYAGGS